MILLAGTILGDTGEWLLPRYGVDPNISRLTFDKMKIDALRSRLLDELKKRKEIGVESINEIRKSLPSLENAEGGEEFLVPGTMVPLSAVAQKIDDVTLPPSPAPDPERE